MRQGCKDILFRFVLASNSVHTREPSTFQPPLAHPYLYSILDFSTWKDEPMEEHIHTFPNTQIAAIKMYTISDTVVWRNISCSFTWCVPYRLAAHPFGLVRVYSFVIGNALICINKGIN